MKIRERASVADAFRIVGTRVTAAQPVTDFSIETDWHTPALDGVYRSSNRPHETAGQGRPNLHFDFSLLIQYFK